MLKLTIIKPNMGFIRLNRFYSTNGNSILSGLNKLSSSLTDSFKHSLRNYDDFRQQRLELKGFMTDVERQLHFLSTNELLDVLTTCSSIHHICNSPKFDNVLIRSIIERYRNDSLAPSAGVTSEVMSGRHVDGYVGALEASVNLIRVLGYEGALEVLAVDDYVFLTLSSSLSKFDLRHLLRLLDNVTFVYGRLKLERYKTLLQRCVVAIFNLIEKENSRFTAINIVSMLKSLAALNEPYLNKRMNQTIINRTVELSSSDVSGLDLPQLLDYRYRVTKGNLHILYTLILTGLIDTKEVIEVLIKNVIDYCIFYFNSTSKIKKYTTSDVKMDKYSVDPSIAKLLYSKYPNKLFKVSPESNFRLGVDISYSKDVDVKSGVKDVIKCSLTRLLMDNKITFCRSLKLSELHLRELYPSLYYNLSNDLMNYLDAVQSFKFNDKSYKTTIDDEIELILTKINLKPIKIMVDDVYPITSLSIKDKIYLEICNGKQARFTNSSLRERSSNFTEVPGDNSREEGIGNHGIISGSLVEEGCQGIMVSLCRSLKLKLNYLQSRGWRCLVVYTNHWIRMNQDQRINYIKGAISTFY